MPEVNTSVGISDIGVYVPQPAISLETLVQRRVSPQPPAGPALRARLPRHRSEGHPVPRDLGRLRHPGRLRRAYPPGAEPRAST